MESQFQQAEEWEHVEGNTGVPKCVFSDKSRCFFYCSWYTHEVVCQLQSIRYQATVDCAIRPPKFTLSQSSLKSLQFRQCVFWNILQSSFWIISPAAIRYHATVDCSVYTPSHHMFILFPIERPHALARFEHPDGADATSRNRVCVNNEYDRRRQFLLFLLCCISLKL